MTLDDYGLIDKLVSTAVFSQDRVHRYALIRIWDTAQDIVAFIGLNPSTADEKEDSR